MIFERHILLMSARAGRQHQYYYDSDYSIRREVVFAELFSVASNHCTIVIVLLRQDFCLRTEIG